jgi:hypothetical protein
MFTSYYSYGISFCRFSRDGFVFLVGVAAYARAVHDSRPLQLLGEAPQNLTKTRIFRSGDSKRNGRLKFFSNCQNNTEYSAVEFLSTRAPA